MSKRNICKFVTDTLADPLRISCFVSETNPEIMQRARRLTAHRMILVVGGEAVFCFDGNELSVRAGMLVLGFCNEQFCVKSPENCQYLYIQFEGSRADTLLRRFEITPSNRAFSGFDGMIPLWSESLGRASEQTVDLSAESMLLYSFSRLVSVDRERNDPVEQIIQLTEERFNDNALTLAAIAEELSYNPKYLSAAFKKRVGMGYAEYLCSVRIKYAISLFDHGLDSVKNVAVLSGYADPLYFSAVFKRKVGISPTEYLKSKS